MSQRLAVVDVETTGFSRKDRIVEVAAVTLDPETWEIVDEFDTLINPERDVGPVNVHGISASMVEAAPTFEEIAAALARRLHRATLIAHNLPFDARMLASEFSRLGVLFDAGLGLCTYKATRYKLQVACERFGIPMSQQHRALGDARATAQLARTVANDFEGRRAAAKVGHIARSLNPRTHRRGDRDNPTSQLVRVVSHAYYPNSDEAVLAYLDALDWVLDDYRIDRAEQAALDEIACDLGVSDETRLEAHNTYLTSIIAAAERDGVTTAAEAEIIDRVADVLGVEEVFRPEVSRLPEVDDLREGMRVCFTGQASVFGRAVKRQLLEEFSAYIGLQPVSGVTKRGCDLLVAADPSSASGKTRKARGFKIPVMSVEEFLEKLEITTLVLRRIDDG